MDFEQIKRNLHITVDDAIDIVRMVREEMEAANDM